MIFKQTKSRVLFSKLALKSVAFTFFCFCNFQNTSAAIPPSVNKSVMVSPAYDEKEGIEFAIALWRDGYVNEARRVLEETTNSSHAAASEREHPLKYYLLARLEEAQNAAARVDEYLKESLQRLNDYKLSDEFKKEIFLFAGQRATLKRDQSGCEAHFRRAASFSSFVGRESLEMLECARIGASLKDSLAFTEWLGSFLPGADEFELLKIEILLKAGLELTAKSESLKLVAENRLKIESLLKLAEIWTTDKNMAGPPMKKDSASRLSSRLKVQFEILEMASLLSSAVEVQEAFAKALFEAGQLVRARQIFERLALPEPRFRHISAELCRSEGRLRMSLMHTQQIPSFEAWLRQEVAIANEKRSWSQLSSFAGSPISDSEVSYAIAYSMARIGDYSESIKYLEQIPTSNRAVQLKQKLTDCSNFAWDCGIRIR